MVFMTYLAMLPLVAGCARGGEDELGTIVYELPEVPGADEPFPLPPLEEAVSEPDAPTATDDHPPASP